MQCQSAGVYLTPDMYCLFRWLAHALLRPSHHDADVAGTSSSFLSAALMTGESTSRFSIFAVMFIPNFIVHVFIPHFIVHMCSYDAQDSATDDAQPAVSLSRGNVLHPHLSSTASSLPYQVCPSLILCSVLRRFHRRPTCRSALLLRPSACRFLSTVLPPSQVLYRNPCYREPAGASKRVKVMVCCNQSLPPQRLSLGGSAHTISAAQKQQVH